MEGTLSARMPLANPVGSNFDIVLFARYRPRSEPLPISMDIAILLLLVVAALLHVR